MDDWYRPRRDPRAWGEAEPIYHGDALVDLHDGRGTAWKRTPAGQYYPDCDCHRPKGLGQPPHPSETAQDASKPAEPTDAPPEAELTDDDALRLLATWLRRLVTPR